MTPWLRPALDYLPQWLEFQMQASEQPGCALAITHQGRLVFEAAWGVTDLGRGTPLTPRHRFRVASHSKTFTAAGIMKLREKGKLGLDDRVGRYASGLHPVVARVTLAQLLSHTAGLTRDGADSGQFADRRPYLSEKELRAGLAEPPMIEPNTRFKYSNHGFGLLGLVLQAVTDEPYVQWIQREIVEAAGLEETQPDAPIKRGTPFARGHSGKLLLGERVVIPGDNLANAMAPAAGFVSTASDLAGFFAQLAPNARRSVLSVASRREMTRRQWRNPHSFAEGWYGLGTISGSVGTWDWVGHMGSFQGYLTRALVVPSAEIAVAVLTNSWDSPVLFWMDGTLNILRTFAQRGAPARSVRDWSGRWWSLGGAMDLVPMGNKVLVGAPGLYHPFMDASELEVTGRDRGRVALAAGYANHGEPARLVRGRGKSVREVWLGGTKWLPQGPMAQEVRKRYRKGK